MPYINPGDANRVIEHLLDEKACKLQEELKADVLTVCAPMTDGLDVFVRECLGGIASRRDRLAVLVQTDGGSIEVVDRLVGTMRHHYPNHVEFIVPNYAMSAGTVLVMSGDAIWMDYFSVLGPIDPQVRASNGRWLPARGYLDEYKDLVEKSRLGTLTNAETAFLLQKFDPAELYAFRHAVNLSVSLLKEWLAKYKFKNWTETRTNKTPVDHAMRTARAEEVANTLGNVDIWHTHGRGIPIQVIREVVRVEIDDFGTKEPLNTLVTDYYRLLIDFQRKNGTGGLVHTPGVTIPLE